MAKPEKALKAKKALPTQAAKGQTKATAAKAKVKKTHERSVPLPAGIALQVGIWHDVAGTPFQVQIKPEDPTDTLWIRKRIDAEVAEVEAE